MGRYERGFTLIELLVTLVVLGVLIGMVAPGFNSLIQRSTSAALGEELEAAFNFARSEAIKRRAPVSICASDATGTACGTNWSNGWIVFVDGAAETADTATVSQVLRFWNDISRNANVTVARGTDTVIFVRFAGMGVLARNNAADVTATAKYTGCTGNAARVISIGWSGMVSSRADNCGG